MPAPTPRWWSRSSATTSPPRGAPPSPPPRASKRCPAPSTSPSIRSPPAAAGHPRRPRGRRPRRHQRQRHRHPHRGGHRRPRHRPGLSQRAPLRPGRALRARRRDGQEAIANLTLKSPGGARIPLNQVAQVGLATGESTITRETNRRHLSFNKNIEEMTNSVRVKGLPLAAIKCHQISAAQAAQHVWLSQQTPRLCVAPVLHHARDSNLFLAISKIRMYPSTPTLPS